MAPFIAFIHPYKPTFIGTIFAYGVKISGKTHIMHRSPGIIPLAVKNAFGITQETPSREFLLRVSYLEIYNENGSDSLPFKSAFKNVIFRKSSSLPMEKPPGVIQNERDHDGSSSTDTHGADVDVEDKEGYTVLGRASDEFRQILI